MNKTLKKINREIDKFQKSGNIQMAVETCKKAILENEDDAQLHIKLGDLYLQWHLDIHQIQQYADEAITEYQRALETSVNSYEIYFKIATAFYYKRDLDKALNYYKLALEHNTKSEETLYMMAEVFMRKGDLIEAVEYAKNAIKTAPLRSARAYMLIFNISLLLRRKSYWEQAKNLLLFLLTLPFDKYAIKDVIRRISYLQFLPMLLRVTFTGISPKMADIYRESIEKAPGCSALYVNLGVIYQELKRLEDAECEYKMAIWLDSLNTRAYSFLCTLYEETKEYEKAISVCEKLIELQPHNAEYQSKMAQYLYLSGNVDAAIEHYQTAITLSKNSKWTSVIAQTLGYIFQENTKNLDAAIASLQNAYNLNSEDIDIYVNLGNVFYEKGSYDNALIIYKKALENSPYNPKIHCNLGYLYWGKGYIDEAVKEYEKAIQYDNTYDIAYNNLGVIYLDDFGKVQKAIELFENARKYNPNYALANYNLARSIAITGDKIEAAKLYQAAAEINKYTQELDPLDIEEKIQDLFT